MWCASVAAAAAVSAATVAVVAHVAVAAAAAHVAAVAAAAVAAAAADVAVWADERLSRHSDRVWRELHANPPRLAHAGDSHAWACRPASRACRCPSSLAAATVWHLCC